MGTDYLSIMTEKRKRNTTWRVSIWISGNRFPESYYFGTKRKAVWFFDQHATAYDVNHIELAIRYPNACFGFKRISIVSN